MNSNLKYFSPCLLALLTQAAFAVPTSGGSNLAVLGGPAVTCTDSTITGNVDIFAPVPSGSSVTQTNCTINGTIHAGDASAVQNNTAFFSAYDAAAATQCSQVLTGTLAGVTLAPGVYCFDAAATLTGLLTLKGPSNGIWLFKVGTLGTGALTGTNLSMVMDGGGQACNVTWQVAQAATMTTSDFLGTILAGAAITLTGGTFNGDALAKSAVTLTGSTLTPCTLAGGPSKSPQQRCNQGVGNGPEGCDPGNSNQGNPFRSSDEIGGVPGTPGRQGGNK